jgi:hypothetical protein
MAMTTMGAVALLALGLVTGCGNGKQTDTLEGPIGPGTGGPSNLGVTTPLSLTKPDGTVMGTLSYDAGFFNPNIGPSDPVQFGTLTTAPGTNITITMTHISGRIDTPCRFNAAVLARDQDYEIGSTGFVSNQLGLQLYQVNFDSGPLAARLFCASLQDNVGLQFMITADIPAKVTWLETYSVMNSVLQ